MDWFDRRILQYVLAWAPHHSMHDEDTFPAFGMRVDQLTDRFIQIVADCRAPTRRLDDADRNLMSRARALQLEGPRPAKDVSPGSCTAHTSGVPASVEQADRHRARLTASKRAIRMAGVAAHAATSRHAGNVVVIDVSAKLPTTDCFVIASGADDHQVRTIVSGVEETMGLAGYAYDRREVARKGRWMLLDYVDIVVHVQHRSERNFFALEQVWRNCPIIPVGARGSTP